jgi:hypothetical protein
MRFFFRRFITPMLGSLPSWHDVSSGSGEGHKVWWVVVNIMNKLTRDGSPAWELGVGLTTHHRKKNMPVIKHLTEPRPSIICIYFGGSASCCVWFTEVIARTAFRNNCVYFAYIRPLHVSALTGHLQAAHTIL